MRQLAALLLGATILASPAFAADEIPFPDITCENTNTAGAGTVTLAGALTGGYLGFSTQVTSGNSVFYNIVTGTGGTRKVEVGKGVWTSPDQLTRVADWSSDGAGVELTLSGTSKVCIDVSGAYFNQGVGSGLNADFLDGSSSAAFQPIDADLTSWAAITRASGFDTFTTTSSSANLDTLVTDDTGSGLLVFGTSPTLITPVLGTPTSGDLSNTTGYRENFIVAASDEITTLTTGTNKAQFRMPYAFTLTSVRCNLNTAATSGTFTVDINESGATIMTTNKLNFDANETTTTTYSGTAATLTDTALADDAIIGIDIDSIGTGGTPNGLKCALIGRQ